jgi:hypothetical protein
MDHVASAVIEKVTNLDVLYLFDTVLLSLYYTFIPSMRPSQWLPYDTMT